MKKLLLYLLCVCVLGTTLIGCGSSKKNDANGETGSSTPKIALLLPGSANDGSFNQKGYNALLHLKDLGYEVTYSEKVSAADQLQSLREYAGMGYNIIIGWGSQFDDDMLIVADEFPDIQFVVGSGTVGNDKNCTSIYVSGAHLGYGYGYLAASVTKTNKVAFIGANQGNQAYTDEVCGFIQGAKAANAKVEVTILYVASYSDVAEAEETTKLCVQKGCDVIFGDISEGYSGVLNVVKENNLYTFGRNAANVADYPTGIIAYIENNWSTKLEDVVNHYKSSGMLTGVTEVGFGTVVSGWVYKYDDQNSMNPKLITADIAQKFQTQVVDKFTKEGYKHNFTAANANPGVY